MNKEFWKGKRVLLTGHTGFKGGWMALWLSQMGAKVTGYALEPSTKPSFFNVAGIENDVDSNIGDIRDLDTLKKVITACQPDIVFHLAAQPLVRLSYVEPLATFDTNVMGTAHLLEACRGVSTIKAAVIITTDKCYENQEWHWGYRENEPLGGHDPYSASKACAEIVTSAYRRSFFQTESNCLVASARAGNVIGGGDWSEDRLLPDILNDFSNGTPVTIRSPNAVRPWQHVLEPVAGYLTLAERLCSENGESFANAWNFGPPDSGCQSVEWIVNTMQALWGEGASYSITDQPQPHEATFLKLDCSRARDLLNWQPVWSLEDTLNTIVDWYQAFKQEENMRSVALNTLKQYEAAELEAVATS